MTDYEFAGSMTEIMNLQEVNWKMSSTTVFFHWEIVTLTTEWVIVKPQNLIYNFKQ